MHVDIRTPRNPTGWFKGDIAGIVSWCEKLRNSVVIGFDEVSRSITEINSETAELRKRIEALEKYVEDLKAELEEVKSVE